jgi:hypothetical protein
VAQSILHLMQDGQQPTLFVPAASEDAAHQRDLFG